MLRAIKLVEEWEADYWQRYFAVREDRLRQPISRAREEARTRALVPSAMRSLIALVDEAIDAIRAIDRARTFPAPVVEARRMYRHLGDALARVMALPQGNALRTSVQDLSTKLLGAVHFMDLKRDTESNGRGV